MLLPHAARLKLLELMSFTDSKRERERERKRERERERGGRGGMRRHRRFGGRKARWFSGLLAFQDRSLLAPRDGVACVSTGPPRDTEADVFQ